VPAEGGPRLVYDAATATSAKKPLPTGPPSTRGRVLTVVTVLLLLGALIAAGVENRRAVALQAQVTALTESLTAARAELAARRQHLDAIRSSVADVRERVGALESLAGADPVPAAPAETAPGH
jgi:hypothetical protein